MERRSRRSFLELALASFGAAALGSNLGCQDRGSGQAPTSDTDAGPGTDASGKRLPNVLFLLVDQERTPLFMPKDLVLETRARLYAQGTELSLHYANAMPCTPSRSVLYTGQHVQKTKMLNNVGFAQGSMSTSLPTMGSLFKELGYRTAYYGKWHLSEIASDKDCATKTTGALVPYGFDEYGECGDIQGTPLSGYRDDPGVADSAVTWLGRQKASDGPWLLSVDFVNPHDVMFYYPGGFAAPGVRTFGFDAPNDPLYRKSWDVELPPHYDEDLSKKPPAQRAYAQMYDAIQRYPDGARGIEARKAFMSYYVNCLRDVDRHMGRVLAALAASPFAGDTLVVFTSDHGELAFSHGMRGKGSNVYEENNHVPFVVSGPGVPRGGRVSGLSSHVDVVPTLLGLVGQSQAATRERHPELVGMDFSPSLRDPQEPTSRKDALMCFDFGGTTDIALAGEDAPDTTVATPRPFLRGVTDGRYKLARYFAAGAYSVPKTWEELRDTCDLELYDRSQDPLEQKNLAADPEAHKALILDLNTRLNTLVTGEAGGELPPTG